MTMGVKSASLCTVALGALLWALPATAAAQTQSMAGAPDQDPTQAEEPELLDQNEVELEAGQDATTGEEVVVTGSRIRSPNLTSAVPITSIGVQDLVDQGTVSLGDALNAYPSLRSTFSQSNSTGSIGTSGLNLLDLRGLGTTRTLVLVNGRRHITATPGTFRVDTNQIPTDLIERVDIVTGGNSGIYGSDAVAGVVNFVLKRDFEGIRFRAQGGVSSRDDRGSYFASLTVGENFADGRGNIAVSAEYSRENEVLYAGRDGQTGALTGFSDFIGTDVTVGESASGDDVPDTTFLEGIRGNTNALGGLFTSVCPTARARNETQAQFEARRRTTCSGTFLPAALGGNELGRVFLFDQAGNLVLNDCELDFRTVNGGTNCIGGGGRTTFETQQLFPGLERATINLLGRFELSPAFEPFVEAKYVHITSKQNGQPTFTGGTLSATFSIDNPFLTPQSRALLVSSLAPGTRTFVARRFSADIGERGENHERDVYRLVAGVGGRFNEDWRYELALNYGKLETFYDTRGNVNLRRFANAANAVRNSAGQIVCRVNNDASTTNDDPACVPINLFGNGSPSAAAIDYVTTTSFRNQDAEQINAVGFISGDLSQLFELPGGPIAFAVGAEYRREDASSVYDPEVSNPVRQTFLNSILPFEPPALEIKEAFGELRIPLLREVDFAHELALEASGRVSDYNQGSTGTVFAYNVGGVYAPVRDLRFRAGYAKAVRAPTLLDLFNTGSQTFVNITDPCDQRFINQNPNRVANCAAAGVPTTEVNPATGATVPFTNASSSGSAGQNRGNPDLREEISKSFTAGFVFQPRFLPGFSLSMDYYDITVDNVIFSLGGQTVVNQCYDDPGGIENQFCAAVARRTSGPFAGTFAGQSNKVIGGTSFEIPGELSPSFFSQPFNYAKLETSGVDLDASYRARLGGRVELNLRGIVSWVKDKNSYSVVTDPNFADRIKSELGDPEWEGVFKANLDFGAVDFGYDLRYIGRQTIGEYETQNSFQGRPPENADAFPRVYYPEVFYHDIRFGVEVEDDFRFYLGVDNVFDRLPPFGLLGTGDGSAIFDARGRFFYAGARATF